VTLRTQEGLRIVQLFPDVTRLGAADASIGAAKRTSAPESDKDTKAQRSDSPGMKK